MAVGQASGASQGTMRKRRRQEEQRRRYVVATQCRSAGKVGGERQLLDQYLGELAGHSNTFLFDYFTL